MSNQLRIFGGVDFTGTYVVYGLEGGTVSPFACDVDIKTLEESDYRKLRAHRLKRKAQGKKVARLSKAAFRDELFVIFGPDASPKNAVTALDILIKNIKKHGLLIGRKSKDGDFLSELYETGEIVG